jgi:hypothetical protein
LTSAAFKVELASMRGLVLLSIVVFLGLVAYTGWHIVNLPYGG